MANVNAPKGFIPVRHHNGSPWNNHTRPFLIPASDATAVFVGDLVTAVGTAGVAGQTVAGQDMEGVPIATLATAGTTGQNLVGAVVGFLVDPTNLAQKYRLASTARVALVVADMDTVYEVEEDAVTSNLTQANIGNNCAYSTTAGNTTTGVSKMEIVSNTAANTATFPFKILGLSKRIGNAFGLSSSDKGKFEVMLNTGLYAPNVAGV